MNAEFELLTTVRLESGQCLLTSLHLDRLQEAAQAFDFRFDRDRLEQALNQAAVEHAAISPAKLRLTVDAQGAWSFGPPESLHPDLPGLRAMLWPEPMDSHDLFLKYKTTHRPIYDPAVREARRLGFVDAIFRNERGLITEGAVHSIFIRHGESWRTPTLGAGVLPGVYRAHLLQTMPQLREEDFLLEDLLTADEVWLTNAVRGIRIVTVAADSNP